MKELKVWIALLSFSEHILEDAKALDASKVEVSKVEVDVNSTDETETSVEEAKKESFNDTPAGKEESSTEAHMTKPHALISLSGDGGCLTKQVDKNINEPLLGNKDKLIENKVETLKEKELERNECKNKAVSENFKDCEDTDTYLRDENHICEAINENQQPDTNPLEVVSVEGVRSAVLERGAEAASTLINSKDSTTDQNPVNSSEDICSVSANEVCDAEGKETKESPCEDKKKEEKNDEIDIEEDMDTLLEDSSKDTTKNDTKGNEVNMDTQETATLENAQSMEVDEQKSKATTEGPSLSLLDQGTKTDDNANKCSEAVCSSKEKKSNDTDDIIIIDDEATPSAGKMSNKTSFKNILKSPLKTPSEGANTAKSGLTDIATATKADQEMPGPSTSSEQTSAEKVDSTCAAEGSKKEDRKRSLPLDNEDSAVEGSTKRSRLGSKTDEEADNKASNKETTEEKSMDSDDDVIVDEKKENIIKKPVCVTVSSQALQNFITACVRGYLKKQKQDYLDRLTKQAASMDGSGVLWKNTARHLKKSMEDLLAQRQTVEKRKAQVKTMSSKSVGVQVQEQVASPGIKTTAPAYTSPSSRISLPPSSRLSQQYQLPPQSPQPVIQAPAPQRYNQPGAHNSSGPRVRYPRPPNPASRPAMQQSPRPMIRNQQPIPQQPSNNLIDLTDDDDNISNNRPPQPRMNQPNKINSIPNAMPKNGNAASKTPNGFVRTGQLPGVRPGAQTVPGQSMRQNNYSQQSPGNANKGPVHGGASPSTVSALARQGAKKPLTAHSLPPSVHINKLPQKHPAPLPDPPRIHNVPPQAKRSPPKPGLKISRVAQGIVLSWNMPSLDGVEVIASYQLFAYQETDSALPNSLLWKKVGDVKALPLPMACTLTQFQVGNKYHFAVRAVDRFSRCGPFSDASTILLEPK